MIGHTGLHQAVLNGDIPLAKRLISHNPADVNMPDRRGETPICAAICKSDSLMMQLLIDNGADLSCVGIDRWNVLHYAAYTKHYEVMRLIAEHLLYTQPSVKLVAENSLGFTPLHFAQCPFSVKQVALLLTFYGKQQGWKDDNWFNICSVEVQQAIEHHMLAILMMRHYKMQLLEHLLSASSQPSVSSNNAIIRAIFLLMPSIEEKGDMARLLGVVRQQNPMQWLESTQYNAIFKACPVFALYPHHVFHDALLDLVMRLKRYIQHGEQEKLMLMCQAQEIAQHEVNMIISYYKKSSTAIHNRSFNLT